MYNQLRSKSYGQPVYIRKSSRRTVFNIWLDRLDELLKTCRKKLGEKFETMRKGLIRCMDYIFNFLSNPAIPSDNNASERGIRKLKIKLKNSCTFRSDDGGDAFLEIHSIVETAKKHNKTPFEAIRALFEGTDKFGVVAFVEWLKKQC